VTLPTTAPPARPSENSLTCIAKSLNESADQCRRETNTAYGIQYTGTDRALPGSLCRLLKEGG
jgi:hypothetical protein